MILGSVKLEKKGVTHIFLGQNIGNIICSMQRFEVKILLRHSHLTLIII